MQHLTIILKPYHACNAACIYCSAHSDEADLGKMTVETVSRIFERIRDHYLETGRPKSIRLIWHGGEPLALPVSFYDAALALQEKLLGALNIRIEHSIQTNLLLLDRSKARMLQRLLKRKDGSYMRVGTSIDPVPGIRRAKGYDYTARWMEKVQLLTEFDLLYGLICVVHRHHLDKIDELYNYFLSFFHKHGTTTRFNPLYNSGRAVGLGNDIHLSPEAWGRFLVEFYRIWEADNKPANFIPFTEYDNYHYHGKFELSCETSGRCMQSHLGINTDGGVFLCGRAIDDNTIRLGHIENATLKELMGSEQRVRLKNRIVYLRDTLCRNCDWWQYCHGGCPNESLSYHGTLAGKSYWCTGRKKFFKEIYGQPQKQKSHRKATCQSRFI